MQCPACQADNAAENRFCEQCGASLPAPCSNCGNALRLNAKFCGACGNPVSSPPPLAAQASRTRIDTAAHELPEPPRHLADKILTGRSALQGERRQVTVLFADLVGFTPMAERRDPEEVHRVLNHCFDLIAAEIHRFEGTINQYAGDGLMALFGAPVAHEDAPRRAVHAALAIQHALADYSKSADQHQSPELAMRIGINTGLVVVGKIGDDLRMEYTAIGDTVNLAARLQQNARAGAVMISEATHKLVEGFFECRDLGAIDIKGHQAVHAFEALRTRGRRARLDLAVERGLTPLVGRERELATLGERFREASNGHGQLICIAGEAGIGKSRLLYEFRRQLEQAGEAVTWSEGRCVSFGNSIPLLPVLDQLRENFGIAEVDGDAQIIAKIEQEMRQMGGVEAEIPYIRHLLSVDPGDPEVRQMEASARAARTFAALRTLTLRGAALRPIVAVFEDLHWIDASTQEYLEYIMDSIPAAPVMFVLTYRMGYRPPFESRSFHTTLNLHQLSAEQSFEMAMRMLNAHDFPEELKATLAQKAEGVPLFVEEVVKTLLDLGLMRRENGGYRLVKSLSEATVPATIEEIIMARLDRLGEDGKRTVQLAAVIGRQFVVKLLARIARLEGRLEGLLRELKALEIIYEQGLLAEPAYIFKHAVIQDVAYNSLLVGRRKELHRGVGEAVEELYADRLAEHYAELAYHFSRAEDWPKAARYSQAAGDRALESFANSEARDHYQRALEAARNSGAATPAALTILHARLGEVCTTLGEHERAVREYLSALDLARTLGPRREMQILVGLSSTYDLSHQGDAAFDYNEQALAIARSLGDRGFQAICLSNRVEIRSAGWGKVAETIPDAEEALRLSKEIRNPALLARSLVFLGGSFQWRGEFDQALGPLREGMALAKESHQGFVFGFGAFQTGLANLSRGNYEEALRWFKELKEYAAAAGDRFFIARAPNLIGGVHLELFDLARAVETNLEASEVAAKMWPWPEPSGHSLLKVGLAHFAMGDYSKADEYFKRAWDLLDKDVWYRWRWHIPLLRARAELALRLGHHEEALGFVKQSLEMAEDTGSTKHIAAGRRVEGETLEALGKMEPALEALSASVALAERMGTLRELWLGAAAAARMLMRLGRDTEAQAFHGKAVAALDAIGGGIKTRELRRSFLGADAVRETYRIVGRTPPAE